MRRLLGGLLLLAVLAGGGWYLVAQGGGEGPAEELVETVIVDRGDITQIVSSTGSVRALITVEVGSQLSGQVLEIYVDFNSPVETGDLLAKLDPQTFQRRVQEAEANLAVARANITVQEAGIVRAQANFQQAKRDFERQENLVARGAVSQAALDTAQAVFESAEADLAIARAQLENAKATVQQREAALEAAQIDLERTDIRSPISGIVVNRAVDVGQTVAASLQAPILFEIAQDLTEIQIEANVDEADIGSVAEGASANFTVDAFPGQTFRGRVSQVRLAPNEEQNVVTYTVVITARNPNRRLLPGMTANVDIVTGAREGVLRVANAALRFRPANADDGGPQSSGGGRGPGGGGGGQAGQLAETFTELGIDDATQAKIREEIQASFASLRGAFADPNADRAAIRARIQSQIEEVIKSNLTEEQFAAYQERQAAAQATRPGTLYILEKGTPAPRRVRLGISDDRNTEIASGDVSEGDEIVTRIRQAPAP